MRAPAAVGCRVRLPYSARPLAEPPAVNPIETAIRDWLDTIVVGLNLCPFAAQPARSGRVRVVVSDAQDELDLLTELQLELQKLDDRKPSEIETTLLAVPRIFADFVESNDFLDQIDRKSVVSGQHVSVRVYLGGRRHI